MLKSYIEKGLVYDLPSNEYHGVSGSYSSSQLKDLLEDPEIFYKKYVSKEIEREEMPAFDIGTYFHTAVLEPDKLNIECAVFKGIRRGKEWEAFKEENKNKAIITENELAQAERLILAVKNSPIAMGRLKRGTPEVSAFIEISVYGNNIYSAKGKDLFKLGKYGWEPHSGKVDKSATKLIVKTRADLLGEDFVLDLKSTTGNTKSKYVIMKKISDLHYDLSASLYLDVFSMAKGKPIKDFIWTFASKDVGNSKSYRAEDLSIQVGRAKWKEAILLLAEGVETQWEFEDSLGLIGPINHDLEYIKQKAEDLL